MVCFRWLSNRRTTIRCPQAWPPLQQGAHTLAKASPLYLEQPPGTVQPLPTLVKNDLEDSCVVFPRKLWPQLRSQSFTTAASWMDPDDGPQKAGAFSTHQLWVAPYKVDERFAAGRYPMQSKGDDSLANWTKADCPIENTDIVAWYTLGFHHSPRPEDRPVMWHDFVLRAFDFFSQSPVLTLPPTP